MAERDARSGDERFVQVGTGAEPPHFVLGGRPFPFVGVNAYFLQEEATRELAGRPTAWVDETLAKAAALGARVVRTWAFNDDPGRDTAIQRAPLVYDEAGLRGLDLVLAKAREHDLRVVLSLVNYWDDYGGFRQYARWHGHLDAVTGDARFYTDRAIVEHFKAHLEKVIGRVNSFTGVGYWEDPTIMAWELANEPRGAGLGDRGERMRAWIDEIAGHVRALAPNQLVTTGEEGFEANQAYFRSEFWRAANGDWMASQQQSFALNVASPFIDFASVHFYPESYGWPPDMTEEAGRRWIREHARISAAHGKPLFVGEFGLRGESSARTPLPLSDRRAIYRAWFAEGATAAAGMALWQLVYDERPDWDPFSFRYLDGTRADDPRNRYADVLAAAVEALDL